MITEISATTLPAIQNAVFRDYAQRYVQIYADFMEQISHFGLDLDDRSGGDENRRRIEQLRSMGANVRNDDKSVATNQLSPSCEACRTGVDSATFFISLRCHRNCYYCINPNQEDYQYFLDHKRNLIAELEQYAAHGAALKHIALTGGEPLLHPEETICFFEKSRRLFPEAQTRLYTSGDHLDEAMCQALQAAGLQEMRISIRLHDAGKAMEHTFSRLALAKRFIPRVMVEMPVLPASFAEMKAVLKQLDQIGIFGVNLLEFCFPYAQPEAFRQRGFKLKARPFQVLYDYWYAGGLPVAGSEEVCLDLVEFAMHENLQLGVHYCSLENKHTGQIFQQNAGQKIAKTDVFSQKDFFIKTAKVFGEDISRVKPLLYKGRGVTFDVDRQRNVLVFHPQNIPLLNSLEVEIGISSNVMETRQDGAYLRELSIGLTTPQSFDYAQDI